MAKLKALGGRLQKLPTSLGSLPPVARSESAERKLYSPWRRWYDTIRWKKLRLAVLTRDLFTCQWPGCGKLTGDTSQLVADHKTPHRGSKVLFWDEGNLWTLCKPCHDRLKQREERAALRR